MNHEHGGSLGTTVAGFSRVGRIFCSLFTLLIFWISLDGQFNIFFVFEISFTDICCRSEEPQCSASATRLRFAQCLLKARYLLSETYLNEK